MTELLDIAFQCERCRILFIQAIVHSSYTQFIYIILMSHKLQFIVESVVKYFDAKFERIWLID
jgi:hypothetical protein